MGAIDFIERAKGSTPEKAFYDVVGAALLEEGHGGYSGTIAEKESFVMIAIPDHILAGMDGDMGEKAEVYAQELIDDDDPRIEDKWGPAGCIDLGGGEYLFFGWASS